MPKTKLTLWIDRSVVERAKRFSRRNETTLSSLVQDFPVSLDDTENAGTPLTSRLRGVLPSNVSLDDYREVDTRGTDPSEAYSAERRAEFMLANAVDAADYEQALAELRGLGLDPADVTPEPPAS